jgi:Fe-S cluster assembly protein SufD
VSDLAAMRDNILEQFKSLKPSSFREERNNAIETFSRLGFPTIRHEEWKYTNLNRILKNEPVFGESNSQPSLAKENIQEFLIAGNDALLLVFENGIFKAELSSSFENLPGIKISNLENATVDAAVIKHLGNIAPDGNEAFVALNTAFMRDGLFIHVQENFSYDGRIHFLHINTSENDSDVSTIRNLVIAEKGSKVSITESYHSLNNNCRGFVNSVTEISVGSNASVEYCKAQLESHLTSQVNFTQVLLDRDSLFDIVTVSLGGNLVRNNLHIKMNDVNSTAHLYGLYILDNEQLTDSHTLVDHAMPNCFSNELYKGIVGGKAAAVFNGKIFVRKDAQKTNAYQSNKNILLSDDAQVNTKPQLEIFADDVKCTHGATTGQLDEEALFYLRSRGIGENSARALLNIAFAGDVLNNIKNEVLKENLMNLAVSKLKQYED